jgi:hypothetical protein
LKFGEILVIQGDYKIPTVRICKKSFDLLQFPNFSTYPMLWQF